MVSKRIKNSNSFKSLLPLFSYILLGLLLLAASGFLIFSNWKISQRRAELTAKIESLKKEIQILEEKNAKLQTGISQTEGGDYWKEKLYEQGYVEKGEQQVVILPQKEEETKKEEKNFWNPQNWLEWIKEKLRG